MGSILLMLVLEQQPGLSKVGVIDGKDGRCTKMEGDTE
jgi:hypothetical protein